MYVNLVIIISSVLCFVIPFISFREAQKSGIIMDENDFIVRKPKRDLNLFIVMTIFFLFLYAISLLSIDYDPVKKLNFALGFFPVLLFGNFLIILWLRWKIIIKDNQITYTPYFGRKKSFTFDYITLVKYGIEVEMQKGGRMVQKDYIKAYREKKTLFYLTDIYPGFHTLVSRLKGENVPVKW